MFLAASVVVISSVCDHNGVGAGSGANTAAATPPEFPFVILPADSTTPAVQWEQPSTNHEVSWGVSAAKSDDRTDPHLYHAFVDVVTNGCTLNEWASNSEVWHAVSSTPLGPFERKELVLPSFASNPQLTRAPDGTYVAVTLSLDSSRSLLLSRCSVEME
jgi:hypothetical protein